MDITIQSSVLRTANVQLQQSVEQIQQATQHCKQQDSDSFHLESSHILSGYGDEHRVSSNPLSVMVCMTGEVEELTSKRFDGEGQRSLTIVDQSRNILNAAALKSQDWTFVDPESIAVKQSSPIGGDYDY
ncbi:hypothetical protein [Paenibacillus antarcticus]|uniref:Uncharacterized protein n=1 Tax=Paenibacillus antarcticus TaxID=253703 RepID=A0A168MSU3_9BACL|nr:hypothetical protein [Paenibacillus antarcticus]OAB45012.1 hypothetical protein PBAT_13770 [Paenibacillus antarcticus]